jgi:hypothetical protein
MKIKSALIAAILITGLVPITASHANVMPVVESFTFTPNEIELLSANTKVAFELVVSHPSGIRNLTTIAKLIGPSNHSLATVLTRTDSPINPSLSKVTFQGILNVPQNIVSGPYNVTVDEVENNSSAGYQFSTGVITPKKIREILGTEFALLIRNNGDLNFVYDTFVGPTHNTSLGISYNNPATFNNSNPPIWKVGEIYDPNKYFELRVPNQSLVVSTTTPTMCSTDGKVLKLVAVGNCTFKVFTPNNKDYALKEVTQVVSITSARTKPELAMSAIANQTSKNLPKSIEIFRVYSPTGVYILPKSTTPTVCIANGFYVQIISGGTCSLTFQSDETTSYLASDLYKVSFEISRDPQTISFTTPVSVNLSTKTLSLSATASGGGVITYQTTSTGICSITGSILNLLKGGNCAITASQAGTTTLAPISATETVMITGSTAPTKKTITCVKGNKTKKVSGTNPKCPKGYKVNR